MQSGGNASAFTFFPTKIAGVVGTKSTSFYISATTKQSGLYRIPFGSVSVAGYSPIADLFAIV